MRLRIGRAADPAIPSWLRPGPRGLLAGWMTTGVEQTGVVELTRRFVEALNARDLDLLRTLVADDVQFPTPEGTTLRGHDGLARIVRAAEDTDVLLAREGLEKVEDDAGATRVTVPVRVIVRGGRLHGTAELKVRDGRIAEFEVVTST
jgi:hypothetical protein